MGLGKNECWRQNRSGTFRGCAFYLLFCVSLCLFVCIFKAVVCILFDWFLRRLYLILKAVVSVLKAVPALAGGICWGQNPSGTFLVVLFLNTFFELFVLFLDLCIVLCLVLSDISPELNTGRSGETVPRFDISPSLGCPFWTLQVHVRSILSITGNQNTYTIVQTQLKHKSPVVN